MKDETPPLPLLLEEAVMHFLRYHPANRVSKNLRVMLFAYLRNSDLDSEEMQTILDDVEGICNLLDVAGETWKEVYE
jgi:hypothetical protein